jgi:hypothetical protein
MFDGSQEDENDPSLISDEDYEAIEALVDKVEHMMINIGCPVSVEPMLWSIVSRKVKYWQAEDNIETEDIKKYVFDEETERYKEIVTKKGFKKGKQLKSASDKSIVANIDGYYHIAREKRILKGHFRWNNRGYILSRPATDALRIFLETEF